MRHSALAAVLAIGTCITVPAQMNSLEGLSGGQYTKPSSGFFPDQNTHITQKMNAVGLSRGMEYCRDLWSHVGCLTYFRTPVRSELVYPSGPVASWPVTDTDFNVKFNFPLRINPGLGLLPYLTVGAGAIMLNGGKTAKQQPGLCGSGLNGQGDVLAGGGFDRRLSRSLGIRIDVTFIGLKQTGFSDVTYRSQITDKVQFGFGTVLLGDAEEFS